MKFHWAFKRSRRLFKRSEFFNCSENPLEDIDRKTLLNLQFHEAALLLSLLALFKCFTEIRESN